MAAVDVALAGVMSVELWHCGVRVLMVRGVCALRARQLQQQPLRASACCSGAACQQECVCKCAGRVVLLCGKLVIGCPDLYHLPVLLQWPDWVMTGVR